MEIKVKFRLSYDEIEEWLSGKYLAEYKGLYKLGKYQVYVGKTEIVVHGYNSIQFGKLVLNNGVLSNNQYSPIIRFYNKLSYQPMGWVCSDTLCSDVEIKPDENGVCTITDKDIEKAIDESWNKIVKFLTNEKD